MSEHGHAITSHRDQIAAEPRPKVLGEPLTPDPGGEIVRLYRTEWTVAWGAETVEECQTKFQDLYHGRVREEDWRITEAPYVGYLLELFLPVCKGEFKRTLWASSYAEARGWTDYTVVARNSKADHDLRAYGTRRL